MATYYWVGGPGTWDSTATHWSLTSGGAGGAGVPTSTDDVVIDAASNTGANGDISLYDDYVLGNGPQCRNLTFAANSKLRVYMTFYWGRQLEIYGDLQTDTTAYGTVASFATGAIVFKKASGTQIINFGGKRTGDVELNGGPSTVYALGQGDAATSCYIDQADGEATLNLLQGTLTVYYTTLEVNLFTSSVGTTIAFNAPSTLRVKYGGDGACEFVPSGTFDTAKKCTVLLDQVLSPQTGPHVASIKSAAKIKMKTYIHENSTVSLASGAYISVLEVEAVSYPPEFGSNEFVLSTSGVTTVDDIVVGVGADPAYTFLRSASAGVRAALQINKGTKLRLSRTTVKDINVVGGGPILADATCIDGGNNKGVLFNKRLVGFEGLL